MEGGRSQEMWTYPRHRTDRGSGKPAGPDSIYPGIMFRSVGCQRTECDRQISLFGLNFWVACDSQGDHDESDTTRRPHDARANLGFLHYFVRQCAPGFKGNGQGRRPIQPARAGFSPKRKAGKALCRLAQWPVSSDMWSG
jgi:hypothetical protein